MIAVVPRGRSKKEETKRGSIQKKLRAIVRVCCGGIDAVCKERIVRSNRSSRKGSRDHDGGEGI